MSANFTTKLEDAPYKEKKIKYENELMKVSESHFKFLLRDVFYSSTNDHFIIGRKCNVQVYKKLFDFKQEQKNKSRNEI